MKGTIKKKMESALEEAFHNRRLCMEDIIKIIKMARELYDLDSAFIVTNREYKYQLRLVFSCEKSGKETKQGRILMLNKAEYDEMLQTFMEEPVSAKNIPVLRAGYQGNALRCAILQGDYYYGHVAFGVKKERDWSEEEKNTLSMIGHLLLIFFGLNYLCEGMKQYNYEKQKFENSYISSGFFLNIKSGKCHAVKLAPFLKKEVQEWEDYQVLLDDYTGRYVDPIYGQQIQERCNTEALKTELSMQNPVRAIDFPRVAEGKVSWYRYVIELVAVDEKEIPSKAYFYFIDITHEIQNKAYISGVSEISNNIYIIISMLDLETEQYAIYVDNRVDDVKDKEISAYGEYRNLLQRICEKVIDEESVGSFKKLFSLENLREYFAQNQNVLKYEFPYTINDSTYWVKLEAVRTQHFSENGKKIVLYFSDITEEKNRELQLLTVSRDLEKEQERVKEVELQANIDPLTGIYNRAGFDGIVKKYREEKVTIGFVLIDVDDFKTINDMYGHEFGDEVLTLIAKRLKSSFRNEDKVFRIGGDEFALLLYGCGADAWRSLRMKFSNIHHYLREVIKRDIVVTLSAGFSQTDKGYRDELYTLADEALYHTKNKGRAGVTQIDSNHNILHFWQDSGIQDRRNTIPKATTIGNWRLEYSEDETQKPRMFLDETTHIMLEIPNILTPEESFAFWNERIVARHRELYWEMKARLVTTGQAECTYHWSHPSKGEIAFRAGATYRENGKTREVFGYMQELKDSDVVLSYDDGQFLMQAMNRIYFCTYYFNLQTKEYYIIKGHEDEENVKDRHENIDLTFEKFVKNFVHPDYQEKVAEFADLKTLSERLKNRAYIDCEYRSSTKIGWCCTRFMPVKWDEQGNLTHAVSMSARIDTSKEIMNTIPKGIEWVQQLKNQLLTEIRTGVWRIEMPKNAAARMYCDEAMSDLLGISGYITPEESYTHWFRNIDPEYVSTVLETVDKILETGHAEVIYPWHHPKRGKMMVRCGGTFDSEFKEGICIYGTHQDISDITLVTKKDDSNYIVDALNEAYFCCYYIDLNKNSYTTYKQTAERKETLAESGTVEKLSQMLLREFVCDENHNEMKQFLCLDKMQERIEKKRHVECEYANRENKEWRRARFLPVRYDNRGNLTHVLLVIAYIDAEKRLELQKYQYLSMVRKVNQQIFNSFQTFLGLINLKNNQIQIIDDNEDKYRHTRNSVFDYDYVLKLVKEKIILPSDQVRFEQLATLERIKEHLNQNEKYEFTIHRYNQKDEVGLFIYHFCYYGEAREQIICLAEEITAKEETDVITEELTMQGFLPKAEYIIRNLPGEYVMLHFDIKGFKAINDQIGYERGNEILKQISSSIKASPQKPLLISRGMADHFYCLLRKENIDYKEILHLCSQHIFIENTSILTSMHCGIYFIDDKTIPIRSICDKARMAENAVQENEGNSPYFIFTDEMKRDYIQQKDIIASLDDAVNNGEFYTYFQPVYNAVTGKIVSAEALVRWIKPDGQIISPGVFIPTLEENGQISRIDMIISEFVQKCMTERYKKKKFFVPVSVNLSRIDMYNEEVMKRLLASVKNAVIPKEYLRFEITESAYTDIPDQGAATIKKIRDYGAKLLIDDFGKGYSSLGSLAGQEFDVVKLDMSFICQIGKNDRAEAVITASIEMAHMMNAAVIAEGVETKEQYEFLKNKKCDYIQGYYFSKPLPREEFEALLDAEDEKIR